jgi:spermidine/putrescine transport system substrate-binding protein
MRAQRQVLSGLAQGQPMTRNQFLAGMGVAAAAVMAGCGSSSSTSSAPTATNAAAGGTTTALATGGSLAIYSWPSYFSTANTRAFEKLTGTKMNVATYQSNDAMFAKLAATNGNSGFDMAIPTSGWIKVMAEKNLLQKIDHAKVPFANIDPQLLNKQFDPGNAYSIPKDYGYNGVIYDPAVIGKPIKTWTDFIDAAKGPASGKTALAIDYETISVGLWAHGYSMNESSKSRLAAAADLMKTVAPHVKAFDGFDITGCVSGQIALMPCDQSVARQVLLQKKNYKFVVPGPHSELWVDNYTILNNASHPDQAYSFIDFQLKPTSQVTDTEFIGYPTVLKGLRSELPKSTKLQDIIFIPPKVYETLETYVVNDSIQGYVEGLANQVQAA